MGRLIVSTHVTLDGVIDSIDRWHVSEGEHEQHGAELLRAADALLLGRKTYEGLSAVWPTMTDGYGYADRINGMPKFVASRTLTGPLGWNATLLEGDLGPAVAELKRRYGGTLLSYGCGGLAHDLAMLGLVDEVRCWVNPTVLGGDGTRLFHGRGPVRLRPTGTTAFPSGVTLLCFQPVTAADR